MMTSNSESSQDSKSRKKIKKSKKRRLDIIDNEDTSIVKMCKKETTEDSWTPEEVEQLLSAVDSHVSSRDGCQTYRKNKKRIKFSEWTIGDHDAEDVERELDLLLGKVRKERSLLELVTAAKNMHKTGELLMPSDRPKMPISMYLRYSISRSAKIREKRPGIKFAEIQKEVAESFKLLSEKKKAKLHEEFDHDRIEYLKAMNEWNAKNPLESFSCPDTDKAPVRTSPLQLFTDARYRKDLKKDPAVRKSIMKCKIKWDELKDKKKLKYFNKAIKAKVQFDEDLETYVKLHPDYKPPSMSIGFLTQPEWKVKNRLDGRPTAPASNGYRLYSMEYCGDLLEGSTVHKHSELWKNLPVEKRNDFNTRARQDIISYHDALLLYHDTLTEDERIMDEEVHKAIKVPTVVKKTKRRTAPVTALSLYIKEKKDFYKKKNPDMSGDCLYRQMAIDYELLSDILKEEYEEKSQKKKKVEDIFPGAPPYPYRHAFSLFRKNLSLTTEFKEILNKDQMAFCSQQWQSANKEKWARKHQRVIEKHLKAREEFAKTLSQEDAAVYLEINNTKVNKKPSVELKHDASFSSEYAEDEHSPQRVPQTVQVKVKSHKSSLKVAPVKCHQSSSSESSDSSDVDELLSPKNCDNLSPKKSKTETKSIARKFLQKSKVEASSVLTSSDSDSSSDSDEELTSKKKRVFTPIKKISESKAETSSDSDSSSDSDEELTSKKKLVFIPTKKISAFSSSSDSNSSSSDSEEDPSTKKKKIVISSSPIKKKLAKTIKLRI